jgi:hypothetical protein
VQELDSDDTDTQGVGLTFEKNRFASDPLQFTGIDLAASRARRGYAYDSDDSEEDSEESDEDENTSALQVALRDKEEALVQSALARIRRAQEKGKREVKLNPDEIAALEKRRKRMQSAATSKENKGSGSSSGSERRRRSDRDLVTVPIGPSEPRSLKRSKSKRSDDLYQPQPAAPPGMLVQGADGVTYAPLGYYPPQAGPSRNSPTRPRSATSSQLRGTPPPQFVAYHTGQANRHFSEGNRPPSSSSTSSRRPLPDEEGWIPAHSRRGSVSSQTHSVDPFEYQISSEQPPPIPQQYIQAGGRRNVSGPPEVVYSSVRRSPPIGAGYPAAARGPVSDPTLRRRSSRRDESSSEEEDESDDLGNGVQVFVEEPESGRERERTVARKPIGSKKRGKGR